MFEFDLPDQKNISTQATSDATEITQEEVAEVIRISENHSLSRTDQAKLLVLVRKLKNRAYTRSKDN